MTTLRAGIDAGTKVLKAHTWKTHQDKGKHEEAQSAHFAAV